MTDSEQRTTAKKFAAEWKDRGYEKGETQLFWFGLLKVFGIVDPEHFIVFEDQVELGHTSFIDARIPATKVLIEQKGLSVNLDVKQKQSDGAMLTPMEQAQRYVVGLKLSEHPRYIVVCNFASFQIFDTETRKTEIVQLADLPKEYYRLSFLTDTGNVHLKREMELSIKAGEIVGVLYDAILKKYKNPSSPETLKSINALCVRLVFCLYAEDAGLFGLKSQFHDYLARFDACDLRRALIDLFKVLDTKTEPNERDPYLNDDLAAFPYVNGGLFADESIEIPQFDDAIKELLLTRASDDFDWSDISPTIFGAVFESTLNPETRRSGGMHYTSIENIHKVIDPLFLDALKSEFAEIQALKVIGTRNKRISAFQDKLASLTFLDPTCGSGNFLTETYLSLRKLENEVLRLLNAGQTVFDFGDVIKVSIGQFYGIEINDFAVTVAKTALWIAESQMMKETMDIVHMDLDFLPLKSYANIVEGNALRVDWETVVPKDELNYIMGNPPFVGARLMNTEQKTDVLSIFKDTRNAGSLDYVCCWYKKSAELMTGTKICAALVSTNSITQGEQTSLLWKPLFDSGVRIDFAHRTFRWDSEAKIKAHVHCVIIGFSLAGTDSPILFNESGRPSIVKNVSPYLIDAPTVFIESRKSPIGQTPNIDFGNMPNDQKGMLSNYTASEYEELVKKYPELERVFKRFYGAEECINNKARYCLWLSNNELPLIRKIPEIKDRVEKVRVARISSARASTKKLADYPYKFGEIRQPKTEYILIPRHSSEHRSYIPMALLSPDIIVGDSAFAVPNATLFHFGVLTSIVHMAWMRAVCGRLKSDYRYSKDIVYNTFPWPELSDSQKSQIEATAQGILDARALYPDSSLADLYDETTMPPELRKAHQANDSAVMKDYGFAPSMTEPEIVAELMNRYQKLTAEKEEARQ